MTYKDYISRSEAIDAICDIRCGEKKHSCDGFTCAENKVLMNLSSKIILCEDCKYNVSQIGNICCCAYFDKETQIDDYCSRGERRTVSE